jgi:hypothetical protein
MCQTREHKYRVTIKPGNLPAQDVVFYAKGMAEAIAKADGYAATHWPGEWCGFTTHRTPYDRKVAKEHGAILPALPASAYIGPNPGYGSNG